jgi:hypothetical protein
MDLPDRFTVDVTPEDIRLGVPGSCRSCPVARAIRRVYRADWIVGGQTAELSRDEWWRHDATKFIAAFDDERPVSPCTVTFTRVS